MRAFAALLLAGGSTMLTAGCATAGSGGPPKVDLLKLLDFKKDTVSGKWSFEGAVLLTSPTKFARIQVPFHPPAEYDVRLAAVRTAGTDSIVMGLVGGGRPFAVIVDAFEKNPFSGIERIDGKAFPDNEAAHPGRIVETGKPVELVYSIRKDRVRVTLDGKPIIDWKADYARVSPYEEWRTPDEKSLWLGSWTAPWRITALELTPVSGEGRLLR